MDNQYDDKIFSIVDQWESDLKATPADYIRALESGLPSCERNKRWIVVCQAYIDASGMGGIDSDPHLILAGFLSTSEVWAKFSDAWKAELNVKPRINCFKFTKHYKDIELKDKIYNLTKIIRSFPLVRVCSYMDKEEFNEYIIKQQPKRRIDHPYWLCFQNIIVETVKDQIKNKLQTPIEFIFDEEGALGIDCLMWYNYFKNYTFPKWVLPYLGDPPSFKNDEKIMPLQAADLYAGLLRYSFIENQILYWPPPKELKLLEEMPIIGGPISLKANSMLDKLTTEDIRDITKKAVEIGKREKEEWEKRKWGWLKGPIS
jgi:hypothetical protein